MATAPAPEVEAGQSPKSPEPRWRALVARAFGIFEDAVYIGLGVLLAYSAAALLVTGTKSLIESVMAGAPLSGIIHLLDRVLVILMVVELLYTVQVSFRAHALVPEPFLLVGIIAATRRILVVTIEFSQLVQSGGAAFQNAMMEVALLIAMVLALVVSLRILRQRDRPVERSG